MSARLDSHVLLRALIDELGRLGMRHACTSPGSRCSPVTLALAREPRITAFSHIDERSAGFFALGAAKASGRPVAVACTSGTAAANLAPAVIEAHHASVPLIVLTADRPPELRDVGAGQTIDQVKLYGDAVKWFAEPDLAEATPARIRSLRALACRVYALASGERPGPVHLNLALREPLVPGEALPQDGTGRPDGRPWVLTRRSPGPPEIALPHAKRPVVVAGTGVDSVAARTLAALCERGEVPLLADPLSSARRGTAAIARYDHLLRVQTLRGRLVPDLVLRFGELPTSKPLRSWLAGLQCRQITFVPYELWPDPDAAIDERVIAPLASVAGALPRLAAEDGWLAAWQRAEAAAATAIDRTIDAFGALSEPAVARTLAESLPESATLFVASSMPVRDLESFSPVRVDPPRVLSNRGTNGIDGTVSAALGAAAASGGPVVLLIGDVALAYDLGGLLAAHRHQLDLTIILINNDGGGIFHFLPVAGERDGFEEHVATPHGLDFAHAAALFEVGHQRVTDQAQLRAALLRSLETAGTRIIEVHTDRDENLELHRAIAAAVADELASMTS